MNGIEFRAIRRFNNVSQEDLAYRLNLNSRRTVYTVEQQSAVPQKYIVALSEMIKVDLMNQKIADKILLEMPEKYFKKQQRHIF